MRPFARSLVVAAGLLATLTPGCSGGGAGAGAPDGRRARSAVAAAAFQRRIPLRYPNGMFNEEAAKLFGLPDAVPTTYLIDRDGVIRERFVGWVDHRTLERAVLDLL